MAKSGTIVFIEDDMDDRIFMERVLADIGVDNKITWFDKAAEAFDFLLSTEQNIFIIFSDINLPGESGLEFKLKIDADPKLRKKSIPFVFYSTSANQRDINEAYTRMTVQGFFKKGMEYEEVKRVMKIIVDYWGTSKHPNTQ